MGASAKTDEKFEIDDLIVAVGMTTTEHGVENQHHVLAKIVGVGGKDIFAISETTNRTFKIAISRCIKLSPVMPDLSEIPIVPRIGDLVLSVVDKYSGLEKKLGLLIEISDVPGKAKIGRLLQGDETETVPFDSLIVIERRGEKK